jgi:hypothetical protein
LIQCHYDKPATIKDCPCRGANIIKPVPPTLGGALRRDQAKNVLVSLTSYMASENCKVPGLVLSLSITSIAVVSGEPMVAPKFYLNLQRPAGYGSPSRSDLEGET